MQDEDLDGYGDSSPLSGRITPGTDCDDSDGLIYPTATEGINDGVDQNCDNQELCYIDEDLDGYGNLAGNTDVTTNLSCASLGFSNTTDDCDDDDATIYPSALELCDGQLNDCNGSGIPSMEVDNDNDLFVECTIDGGGWDGVYIEGGGDCDDNDSSRYPFGVELCDGVANICGTGLSLNEIDNDGDLYVECSDWIGSSSILGGDDCADGNIFIHPNAAETVANGVDEDCDNQERCYIDADLMAMEIKAEMLMLQI